MAFAAAPVLPNVPAMVMPVPEADAEPTTRVIAERLQASSVELSQPQGVVSMTARGGTVNMTVTVRGRRNHVVLEFDRAFITAEMLPALAARHFPDEGSDTVRLSVTDGGPKPLFVRGLAPGRSMDAASADAAAAFFGLRLEMYRVASVGPIGSTPAAAASDVGFGAAPDQAITATVTRQQDRNQFFTVIEQSSSSVSGVAVRGVSSRWTLLLQHAAGSLDAAVAQARRRNLLLSFGILGVLAASVGLVMINARRAEKLAAQQMDFVATVSHELRTPIAVIRSAAQNLSAGVIHDPGHATRYGDLIESEGRRLTDMIEQVLEYAGLSDARRTPSSGSVNAPAVARDVVAAFSLLPEAAGVAFDVQIDPGVPSIRVDEEALRRALQNLIGNAVKHAGEGRWVGVSVARGQGGDRGSVLVSVADRGPGIAADDLPHIFEPFYRGRQAIDRQIRGNGLGLSLVKLMVEAHDGRVSVTSAPGQGSTFMMRLPVATGASTGAA